MIGQTVGTYRILSKLGEGGMGTVYMAEHTLLGRRAAIKVLLPEMSVNQSIVNRFFNEARAVTSISDPGIVQVFDFGFHTDGSAFIVMEMLIGESVEQRLQRMGRIPVMDTLRIGRQVASSLAAAHACGVIHRDLKPDNIFVVGDPAVTGGERAKILDFGIAKLSVDPGKDKTRTGMLIGTPVYMSPEQCRGAGDIDLRSDIYSLGCVLFRMLVGRPPFDGHGSGVIIASHLMDPAPAMRSFAPDLPAELDEIVLRCLTKHPDGRPQTAIELADLLGSFETGQVYKTPMPMDRQSMRLMAAELPRHLTPRPQTSPHVGQSGFTGNQHTPAPHGPPTGPYLNSSNPTTMQGAAGQSQAREPAPRSKRGLVIGGIAAAVIAAGVIAIVAITGGAKTEKTETTEAQPATATSPSVPVAAPPVAPPPVTPPPVTPPPVTPPPVAAPVAAPVMPPVVEPPVTAPTFVAEPVVPPPAKPKKKPTKPTAGTTKTTPTTTGPIDRGD